MTHARFSKLQALSAVRDARDLSKTEKLVLTMLISRADGNGSSFPSLETLGEDCDLARSVVAAVIAALAKRTTGQLVLTIQHRGRADGSGGRSSNLYRLTLRPSAGRNPTPLKSAAQTQVQGELSLKTEGVKSETTGGLSPPAGLEAVQEAVHRSRKGSSKRSAVAKADTDPRVAQLWSHYHAEHERLRGVAPVFAPKQRGAVGNAWKQILAAGISLEEAKQIVTEAVGAGYHVQPTAILANLNRYRGNQPARGPRKLQVQRGAPAGVDPTAYGREGALELVGGAE